MGRAGGTQAARSVVASHLKAWSPLKRPVGSSRVALISSSAVRLADQAPFTPPEDTSFRSFPIDAPAESLRIDHTSPVGTDARIDLEVVLPRAALLTLAKQGDVGSVAPQCFTFVGGTALHERIENELAPALAEALLVLDVDLALLVPY